MKGKMSKILSVILTVTMVFSSVLVTDFEVKADVTTEEMVANAQYNLALKKSVLVSPSLQEGDGMFVTDGVFTPGGLHAATTFGTKGTYYQIDLGDAYDLSTLDQLVVGYKENNDGDIPAKGYKIQISTNGLDFTDTKTVSGTHVKDACQNNNLIEVTSLEDAQGEAVRYVRLYYPDSYTWGIQVTEIAVLDTDGNAQTVEIEKCDKPAGVVISSPDYNTISYRVEAGEDQEDYKYMVYLINAIDKVWLIGNGVEAGKEYTADYLFSGVYTVKVVACYNGMVSDEIVSEKINVSDLSLLIDSDRNISNAYAKRHPAKIVEMKSIYEGHSLETAYVALDGALRLGEGPDNAMRTGTGSPQYFVIDLGDYYAPSEMEEVILAYTNSGTYASDAKIEISLDGKEYTEVANDKGYDLSRKSENFCATNRIKLDKLENYTKKAFRYVKITLSGGGSSGGYGYAVNEASVIANTDTPTIVGSKASDIIVDTSSLEKIKYTIVAEENQEDITYIVSLGDDVINEEAKADIEYEYEGVEAGTYEIKVQTIEDGWISRGITKEVIIDGYANYINTSLNLALKSKHDSVTVFCDNDNTGDNYLEGSKNSSAGVNALNNGTYTNFIVGMGYLQTRPDKDEANIVYDLGKEYNKDDIYSVISMYDSTNNAATEYEIYFSSTGEEDTYEKVSYVKDAEFNTFAGNTKPIYRNDRLDVTGYTQDTVRYVKYHIITGNYVRYDDGNGGINENSDGYHLCELAVMGNESLVPDMPLNVSAQSPEYDTIVVKWDDISDETAVYNIYLDGKIVTTENAGVNEKILTVNAGTHTIKVSAVVDGIESKTEDIRVTVETEETTVPPTETTTNEPISSSTTVEEITTTIPTTSKEPVTAKKPGRAKIKKVKVLKRKVSIKLKRTKGAKGYKIQCSLKPNFKKARTITTRKINVVIKRLKSGKRYYIRVRAYKIVKGKKVYGSYSKRVRTKKIK